MGNYTEMIRSTFEHGSVRDADMLFNALIKSAFPDFNFRRLELICFTQNPRYMEGRSWNHVFEVWKSERNQIPVWEVHCRRVTMGKTTDKHVYLDYETLAFVSYSE